MTLADSSQAVLVSLAEASPAIALVIPAYEAGGQGENMLQQLLASIDAQTYPPAEVIVVDHSRDFGIANLCGMHLTVTYHRNEHDRGNGSANMNVGLSIVSSEIVKVMHIDDFFCSPLALERIRLAWASSNRPIWGGLGFNHLEHGGVTPTRPIIPSLEGTMGCPSVHFFPHDDIKSIRFDENLININDHDLCQRLLNRYGPPVVIPEVMVTIGTHPWQVSNQLDSDREVAEADYYRKKRELAVLNTQRHRQASDIALHDPAFSQAQGRSHDRERRGTIGYFAKSVGPFLARTRRRRAKQPPYLTYLMPPEIDYAHDWASPDPLSALANQRELDKGTRMPVDGRHHGPRLHFTPVYDRFFARSRGDELTFLEIGIGGGGIAAHVGRLLPEGHDPCDRY